MCSRTNPVSWALDDVHFLRALLKGEPEPRVYGSVTRVDNDSTKGQTHLPTPVEGIRIEIEGEGQRFEAVTDEHGRYSLTKVPDGRYKARPLLPDKYMVYFPTEAGVHPRRVGADEIPASSAGGGGLCPVPYRLE